jgi:hypothetical protein
MTKYVARYTSSALFFFAVMFTMILKPMYHSPAIPKELQ